MYDNEVINDQSPRVKELLSAIEEAKCNIEQGLKTYKPMLNEEHFLNNRQVCQMLNISQRSLQDYRDKGLIDFYKLEGKILYAESDVLKLLNNNYCQAWNT
jgi:hypothetical protein